VRNLTHDLLACSVALEPATLPCAPLTPCSLLKVSEHFGGICHLHLQGRRISRTRNWCETGREPVVDFQQTTETELFITPLSEPQTLQMFFVLHTVHLYHPHITLLPLHPTSLDQPSSNCIGVSSINWCWWELVVYVKRGVSCRIWGFHGDDYEECHLLGCSAMWAYYKLTFRRNVSPLSSG
jgi:hypothetical protein